MKSLVWQVIIVATLVAGNAVSHVQQAPPDVILSNGKIKDIKSVLTMMGGRIVYDAATATWSATK